MADSPSQNAGGIVEVQITSEGNAIPDTYQVLSVRTRAETNRIPEAVIVLLDGDPASESFPITDSETFLPGSEIEIKAGYGLEDTETIFTGVVTGLRLRLHQTKGPTLEVTVREAFFKTTMGRKSAIYTDQLDSDIIETLASDAGLTATVDATTETWPGLVQSRVSDWDFMLLRAEANGMVINIDEGEAIVAAPDETADPVLTVAYGQDIYDLDVETYTRNQFENFTTDAWDPATQAVVSGEAAAGDSTNIGDLSAATLAEVAGLDQGTTSSSPIPEAFLTTMSDARSARADIAKLRGTVKFNGSATAKLGTTIELSGVSDRFDGTGYVSGVVHQIEGGAWLTQVMLGLEAPFLGDRKNPVAMPAASAIAAPTTGLHIGKVTKLSEDPDGMSRIQVTLPALTGTDAVDSIWARYAAPYASSGAGLMVLPEIDDEVVLGFLDDNPAYPVILGSLHSTEFARPVEIEDDDNNIKVFLSREGLKLEFDEEKKVITLLTPAGNTVVMDDDAESITITDQNGNSGTFDSSGITLESASDIAIKASGNITLDAGGNIEGTATGDFKAAGVNVEANAQASFKGAGGASAELSGGGSAKVSAPMVQIN